MAQTGTPIVRDNTLYLANQRPIPVGSAAWFAWLREARCFSYQPPQHVDRLTFRREKRRAGCYWYAYLKRDGKLHNGYAGRPYTLTPARLQQVFRRLMAKVTQQEVATNE